MFAEQHSHHDEQELMADSDNIPTFVPDNLAIVQVDYNSTNAYQEESDEVVTFLTIPYYQKETTKVQVQPSGRKFLVQFRWPTNFLSTSSLLGPAYAKLPNFHPMRAKIEHCLTGLRIEEGSPSSLPETTFYVSLPFEVERDASKCKASVTTTESGVHMLSVKLQRFKPKPAEAALLLDLTAEEVTSTSVSST